MILLRDRPDPLPGRKPGYLWMRSYQYDFFESDNTYKVGHWGRRTGKTTTLAAIATEEISKDNRVLVVTPNLGLTSNIRQHILGSDTVNQNLSVITYDGPHCAATHAISPDIIILDEYLYIDISIRDVIAAMKASRPNMRLFALSSNNNTYDYLGMIRPHCYYSSIPTTHPEVGIDLSNMLEYNFNQEFIDY